MNGLILSSTELKQKSWGDEMFGGWWGYDATSHKDLKQPVYEAQKVPIDAEIEKTEKSLMNLGYNPAASGAQMEKQAYMKATSTREVQPNTPADQLVEPDLNEQLMAGAGNSGTTANKFSQAAQERFSNQQARNAAEIAGKGNLVDESAFVEPGGR